LYNRRSTNDKLSAGSRRTAARLPCTPAATRRRSARALELGWARCSRRGQMYSTGARNTALRRRPGRRHQCSRSSVLALTSMSHSSEICVRAVHTSVVSSVYRCIHTHSERIARYNDDCVSSSYTRRVLGRRATRWSFEPVGNERRKRGRGRSAQGVGGTSSQF